MEIILNSPIKAISIRFASNSKIRLLFNSGINTQITSLQSYNVSQNYKIAIKYGNGQIEGFVDGVSIGNDSVNNMSANDLNILNFKLSSQTFYGRVRQVKTPTL